MSFSCLGDCLLFCEHYCVFSGPDKFFHHSSSHLSFLSSPSFSKRSLNSVENFLTWKFEVETPTILQLAPQLRNEIYDMIWYMIRYDTIYGLRVFNWISEKLQAEQKMARAFCPFSFFSLTSSPSHDPRHGSFVVQLNKSIAFL